MNDLVYTSGEGWVSAVESPTKDSAMMVLRPAMVGRRWVFWEIWSKCRTLRYVTGKRAETEMHYRVVEWCRIRKLILPTS